jgi:isocitrate lyase
LLFSSLNLHSYLFIITEDQYSLKRCGHLGGKGLDDIYGWVTTMKAANLAASIFPGVKRDGPQQNVNFCARTDALSAEFIQYSNKMHVSTCVYVVIAYKLSVSSKFLLRSYDILLMLCLRIKTLPSILKSGSKEVSTQDLKVREVISRIAPLLQRSVSDLNLQRSETELWRCRAKS